MQSSKVARKAPSGLLQALLIWPRMPDTVLILAPSNLATSNADVNIFLMNAVFLKIFNGSPSSFSFFVIWVLWFASRMVPVAIIRNPSCKLHYFAWMPAQYSGEDLGTISYLLRRNILDCEETSARFGERPPKACGTCDVLWRVLEHPGNYNRTSLPERLN